MNIGIDLDGTAWDHREMFREIILGLKSRGHKVQIITAHINLVDADMRLWANRGFPPVDGYICKEDKDRNIPSREWKLPEARKYGLDYIFDDFDTGEVRLIKV